MYIIFFLVKVVFIKFELRIRIYMLDDCRDYIWVEDLLVFFLVYVLSKLLERIVRMYIFVYRGSLYIIIIVFVCLFF